MNKARKVVLMLLVGLLLAGQAHVQEVKHAPTIEQCRADQRLWLDKLESSDTIPEDFRTLNGWSHEMGECTSVDPENQRRYYNVRGEIQAVMVMRLEAFLERHGLFDKFIEEDRGKEVKPQAKVASA
jgi:hypothetical protein